MLHDSAPVRRFREAQLRKARACGLPPTAAARARPWAAQLKLLLPVVTALACGGGAPAAVSPVPTRWDAFDHAHFRWISAQCVDGALDLAGQGFERTLTSELDGKALRLTYESRLAQPQCVSTEVWSARPEAAGQWQFEPGADVRLPADAPCGAASSQSVGHGMIQLSGDTLEELRFNSPWCRGFDVRFVYRRIPAPPVAHAEIVRRYVAHWNRRDPKALAALFAQSGALIEPFTRSSDGLPVRHEGRAAIEAWLASAFHSVPWQALQLRDVETLDERGQVLATWSYFDAKLAEPLAGRNLFVLAGEEIFATELQLVSEPVPASAQTAHEP
jgi:hypothetical protein